MTARTSVGCWPSGKKRSITFRTGLPEGGWVILKDPDGRGPNVSLNQTSEGPLDEYRLHLDLYTEDQAGDVVATHPPGRNLHRSPEPGEDFVVLADPDGNLFCVVNTKQ